MKTIFTFLLSSFICVSSFGQYWQKTNASTTAYGADAPMRAGQLNGVIYASCLDNVNKFIISTDSGVTWSTPKNLFDTTSGTHGVIGTIIQYVGVKNKMYIRLATNQGNLFYYSTDQGNNWIADTINLKNKNMQPTLHKDAYTLRKLPGDYLMAIGESGSNNLFYKHADDPSWSVFPSYDVRIRDITNLGSTWYTLNPGSVTDPDQLTMSSNQGATWTNVPMNGLPSTFGPTRIASNGVDKLYLAGTVAGGGTHANIIFYSTDGGSNWVATNAVYTHTLAMLLEPMFAIEDYAFGTFYPDSGDQISKIVTSSTATPSFSECDLSGLPTNTSGIFHITPPFLNYFNVGDKLFITYYDDIYSSQPGFTGTVQTSNLSEVHSLSVYPNPTSDNLFFEATEETTWRLFDLNGRLIRSGKTTIGENSVNIEGNAGVYFLQLNNSTKKIIKM